MKTYWLLGHEASERSYKPDLIQGCPEQRRRIMMQQRVSLETVGLEEEEDKGAKEEEKGEL